MHFSPLNIINAMYIQYITEIILPFVQNIVGICEQAQFSFSTNQGGNPS